MLRVRRVSRANLPRFRMGGIGCIHKQRRRRGSAICEVCGGMLMLEEGSLNVVGRRETVDFMFAYIKLNFCQNGLWNLSPPGRFSPNPEAPPHLFENKFASL